jgi:hypothetical protein
MEDDHSSVASLPERLSRYHQYYYYSTESDTECDISAISAPSNLERFTIHALLRRRASFNANVTCNSSSFYDDDMAPPTPPSPQSEYTSFVNASPSPPHHRALALCLSKSQDSVEHLYLRPIPKPAKATAEFSLPPQRLTFSPIPEEQGEERTVEDYMDSIASVDDLSFGSSEDDSRLGVGINRHSNQQLLQPDLIMDAPTGITLVFDSVLDCIDPPGIKHLCRDSNYHKRQTTHGQSENFTDDRSISSIDVMLMEDGSSFPSGSNSSFNRFVDVSLVNILEKEGHEEPQWLFPCWDEGFDSPKQAESPEKKRSRGRSSTRRPLPPSLRAPSDFRLFEEDEEVKVGSHDQSASDSSQSTPPPPPSLPFSRPRANTSESIMYVSDESSDLGGAHIGEEMKCSDNDDDSLSKLLRGLDFEDPLFDDNGDLFKLDRTQTTDGDCTLSYSSFTY